MKAMISLGVLLTAFNACALQYIQTISGAAPADVKIKCEEAGSWKFEVAKIESAKKDTGEIEIKITSDKPAIPP